jgi:hypothetical protein
MFPWEANILNCIPGDEISFCRKSDLQWGWWQDLKAQESNRAYYSKGHLPGMKSLLKSKLVKFIHNS